MLGTIMNKLLILLLSTFVLSACNTFLKVDYKYSNLSHMRVDDATLELDLDPKLIIFSLSDTFSNQGNAILNREKLDFYYKKTEKSDSCWNASNETTEREFYAYQQNDFSLYEEIDRKGIFAKNGVDFKCQYMEIVNDKKAESWFLQVEIPQGNYESTIEVSKLNSSIIFSGTTPISTLSTVKSDKVIKENFSSMLYIWAWKETPNSKTKVYLLAKPVTNQIESCNGCSIVHTWWKQANGYAEFKLVKRYKYLLEDLARKIQLNK